MCKIQKNSVVKNIQNSKLFTRQKYAKNINIQNIKNSIAVKYLTKGHL